MPQAIIAFPKFQDEVDDVIPALWRGGVSEFFATMIFVFIGTGSVVASQAELGSSAIGVPNLTLIALAHGFCIMVLVYTVGEVSGGFFNLICIFLIIFRTY
jgi:glycerol uptake facilitator-like aquaporin